MKHGQRVLRGFDQKVIQEFGRLCKQCEDAITPDKLKDTPRVGGMTLGEEQANARIVWPIAGREPGS